MNLSNSRKLILVDLSAKSTNPTDPPSPSQQPAKKKKKTDFSLSADSPQEKNNRPTGKKSVKVS
jgi:hypothetical protein